MGHLDASFLQVIADHSHQGVLILSPHPTRIRFTNQIMQIFTGYEVSELLDMEPQQLETLFHEATGESFSEKVERLVATGAASERTELQIVGKAGAILWVQASWTAVELEGQPAVLLELIDDTQRRRTAQELQQSRSKLLQAQYIAGIGDFTWDIATGDVTWSDGMYRLLGYDPGEELDLSRVNREIHHPRDVERVTAWLQAGIASGEEVLETNEYRLLRKDGSAIHVQTNGRFEFEAGKAVRLFGTCLDITEQKRAETALRESEQRLRSAQRLANMGDWWWDVRTGEVEWSDTVYEIFQLNPEEFTPQIDSILDLSPWPEEHERDQQLIQQAIESREVGSYEQRFLRPDGSEGYYASTFVGIFDDSDDLVAMRGIVQDITERKRTEAEYTALQEQLHQAQKMESVGRLAGGVAHDFNNMICAIGGHVELMLDDPSLSDDARSSMKEVLQAANRAANLTRQLLAFSRKQIIEPRIVDLDELVRRLQPMLARLLGEDVHLRTLSIPKLGSVKVDPGLIEQIVLNLTVNARDAMPDGGELTIETANVTLDDEYCRRHSTVEPGAYVMLAVSDTGEGIPDELRDKIFEPFFTTKQVGKGTGLGLAMVFGVVEQNKGRIEVYSEPGHGTTFKVYFPRVFQDPEDLELERMPQILEGDETILVVEDEEMVRTLAVKLLQRQGYEILAVGSGEEALELAPQHEGTIHLLLTDVVMPGMNGRELATALRGQRPELKVLFTSGYTDNVIAHHGLLDAGVEFLSKPYSMTALATRVRRVLDTA